MCAVGGDAIRNVLRHGRGKDAGEEALFVSGECVRLRKRLIGSGLDVMRKHVRGVEKTILHWRRLSHCGAPLFAPSGVCSGTI